jgi:F-type H+-transporting ATPase subunit epsilon
MAGMSLNIVTAERETFSGSVDYITAPGADGELTVLPSHAALMTTLAPGEMRFGIDGEDQAILVTGGFMEVLADNVTVLADAAEREDEIDEARAEEAVRRAQERIETHGADMDMERALASLRRAQIRLRFSQRRRRSER